MQKEARCTIGEQPPQQQAGRAGAVGLWAAMLLACGVPATKTTRATRQVGRWLRVRAGGLVLGFPAHTHQVTAMGRCECFRATAQVSYG